MLANDQNPFKTINRKISGKSFSIGPKNAPITLVEFSDYQCPFCEQWYQDVYSRLMTDYAGKIRFVYRDFPLYAIHPDSQSAAEAALCAGEQNGYCSSMMRFSVGSTVWDNPLMLSMPAIWVWTSVSLTNV